MSDTKRKIILKKIASLQTIWHPETTLIFKSQKERLVIGRYVNGEIITLDDEAMELCSEWNFKPDPSLVAESDDESNDDEAPNDGDDGVPDNDGEASDNGGASNNGEASNDGEASNNGEASDGDEASGNGGASDDGGASDGGEASNNDEASNNQVESPHKIVLKIPPNIDKANECDQVLDLTRQILAIVDVKNDTISDLEGRYSDLEGRYSELSCKYEAIEKKFSAMKNLFT